MSGIEVRSFVFLLLAWVRFEDDAFFAGFPVLSLQRRRGWYSSAVLLWNLNTACRKVRKGIMTVFTEPDHQSFET